MGDDRKARGKRDDDRQGAPPGARVRASAAIMRGGRGGDATTATGVAMARCGPRKDDGICRHGGKCCDAAVRSAGVAAASMHQRCAQQARRGEDTRLTQRGAPGKRASCTQRSREKMPSARRRTRDGARLIGQVGGVWAHRSAHTLAPARCNLLVPPPLCVARLDCWRSSCNLGNCRAIQTAL